VSLTTIRQIVETLLDPVDRETAAAMHAGGPAEDRRVVETLRSVLAGCAPPLSPDAPDFPPPARDRRCELE
jgi:hypothetical protein